MVKPSGSFEWGVVLTGSAVVSTTVLFYAFGWDRTSVEGPEPVTVEVRAAVTPLTRPAVAPRVARSKPRPRSTFAVTAERGDSWIQIRAGSYSGRVLFEGVLPLGETVRLRSQRLWVRLGAASHLDLFVDGRRVWLPAFGTYDAFVTRRGVAADRTDYATAAQSP